MLGIGGHVKKPKPEHPPDDAEQSARFVETAKKLEADKNAKAFERAIGVIVPPQSPDEESP